MAKKRRASGERQRCAWAKSPLMIEYHDDEWGRTGTRRSAAVRVAHPRRRASRPELGDHPQKTRRISAGVRRISIAHGGTITRGASVERLCSDAGIVRNRLKIAAAITNARAFLALQEEYGSFDCLRLAFRRRPPTGEPALVAGAIPARTPESDAMSARPRRRGFKFVGSTICYAFMQAIGMVNDHTVGCFRGAVVGLSPRRHATEG